MLAKKWSIEHSRLKHQVCVILILPRSSSRNMADAPLGDQYLFRPALDLGRTFLREASVVNDSYQKLVRPISCFLQIRHHLWFIPPYLPP